MKNPTKEQLTIIQHDINSHATVLAVAGSGKTSTMIDRIEYLVKYGVKQNKILATMYNKLSRIDFENKLNVIGLNKVKPRTFNSIGLEILNKATNLNIIPAVTVIDDKKNESIATEAIKKIQKKYKYNLDVDKDEFIRAVFIWKSMMTPPEEAKYSKNNFFIKIYEEYEKIRYQKCFITFQDQIYDAVRILEGYNEFRESISNTYEHIIIDEFQDVNYARLMLMKIIAGNLAKVMVVGDDDQCIYEWQGAMPFFIKKGWQSEFAYHNHSNYKLSYSFRFGPVIAQIAANVISHNTDRVDKDLIANDTMFSNQVSVNTSSNGSDLQFAVKKINDLIANGATYGEMAVLVGKYNQSYSMQSVLLANNIPFFVDEGTSIENSKPIELAILYIKAATDFYKQVTSESKDRFIKIANSPSRFARKVCLENILNYAINNNKSISDVLFDSNSLAKYGLVPDAVSKLYELGYAFQESLKNSYYNNQYFAGEILKTLMSLIPFDDFFKKNYQPIYVEDMLEIMRSFAVSLYGVPVTSINSSDYIDTDLDTKRGYPEQECIRVTTIFKAKGLEWDHVFLPDLTEGQLPDLRPSMNMCQNYRCPWKNTRQASAIESQRRLFYVAVTRARKTLHLFANFDNTRPLSRFVVEADVIKTSNVVNALQGLIDQVDNSSVEFFKNAISDNISERLHNGIVNIMKSSKLVYPENNILLAEQLLTSGSSHNV